MILLFELRPYEYNHPLYSGNNPIGIHNGIDGLMNGEVAPISWSDVTGWVSEGGALLGTRRTLPDKNFDKVAENLKKFDIQGIMDLNCSQEEYHCYILH